MTLSIGDACLFRLAGIDRREIDRRQNELIAGKPEVFLLTDGKPANSTLFVPVYIYDQAFEFLGFGYGAMLSLGLLGVTALLITLQALLARRWRLLS